MKCGLQVQLSAIPSMHISKRKIKVFLFILIQDVLNIEQNYLFALLFIFGIIIFNLTIIIIIQHFFLPLFSQTPSYSHFFSPSHLWPLFSLFLYIDTHIFLSITCSVCIMFLACMFSLGELLLKLIKSFSR